MINSSRWHLFRRGISFVTAGVFCLSNLFFIPIVSAAPSPSRFQAPLAIDFSSLALPEKWGEVEDISNLGSEKQVLLLQDAHTHYDAQLAISEVIGFLTRRYHLKSVVMEGGVGEMDPLLFRTFPDPARLQRLFDEFMQKGEISGVTAAAVLSESPVTFYGAENALLYREQIQTFLEAASQKNDLSKKLDQAEKEIDFQKQKFYSPRLLELERQITSFEKNEGSILHLLPVLAKIHPPDRFPSLQLILKEIQLEEIQVEQKPGLFKRIKADAFLKEFNQFLEETRSSLIKTPEERRIHEEDRRFQLLRKLVLFQLTPDEWHQLKNRNINPRWEPLLKKHVRFYEIAEERDEILFQNLSRILKKKEDRFVVFVGGGFHTRGIAAKLRKAGISHAVFTPRIHEVDSEDRYLEIMQGKVFWRDHFKVRDGMVDFYESFSAAGVEKLARPEGSKTLKEWRDRLIRSLASQGRIGKAGDYTRFIDQAALEGFDSAFWDQTRREWEKKLEQFLKGLKLLVSRNELTEGNLARLFKPASAVPPAVNPLFHRAVYPVGLLQGVSRAEVRSEPEDALQRLFDLRRELKQFMALDSGARGTKIAELEPTAQAITNLYKLASSEWDEWHAKASELAKRAPKMRITRSDREEAITNVLNRLTLESDPVQGSLIGHLVQHYGTETATSFASAPHEEWLKRVQDLERTAEETEIRQGIEDFKKLGERGPAQREAFWRSAPLSLQRRLVKDLAQKMRVRFHELLTKDIEGETPYADSDQKLKGLLDSYREDFKALGVDPDGQRRIKYFLEELFSGEEFTQELGFSIRDRIWEWEEPEKEKEKALIYWEKLNALVRLMDFLAGIPGKGAGHVWASGDFVDVQDPQRLLADVLDENVFRSSWVNGQGNTKPYSRKVFHDLGFRTGGIIAGEKGAGLNYFYQLVERASVIRSFKYFEKKLVENFPLLKKAYMRWGVRSFHELSTSLQIGVADLVLKKGLLDDAAFRDSLHIVRRFDLTRRVFQRVARDYLKAVYSWERFLLDVLSRIKDLEKAKALGRKFIFEFKEDGLPSLSLIQSGEKSVSGFVTYGRYPSGKVFYEDFWELEEAVPFDEGKQPDDWKALGRLQRRSFFNEENKEVLRIDFKSDADGNNKVVAIYSIEYSGDKTLIKKHSLFTPSPSPLPLQGGEGRVRGFYLSTRSRTGNFGTGKSDRGFSRRGHCRSLRKSNRNGHRRELKHPDKEKDTVSNPHFVSTRGTR